MAQLETLHPHACGLNAARPERFSAAVRRDSEQRYAPALATVR